MATETTSKNATTETAEVAKSVAAPVTDFISSIIDSTKGLVDNLVDAATDVEEAARKHAGDALQAVTPTDEDIEKLRKHVRELTDQVEKLAKIRSSK